MWRHNYMHFNQFIFIIKKWYSFGLLTWHKPIMNDEKFTNIKHWLSNITSTFRY